MAQNLRNARGRGAHGLQCPNNHGGVRLSLVASLHSHEMNLIPRSFFLLLAAVSIASCASVPPPATRAPANPANPAATEAPIQKLDLFGPDETPPPVTRHPSPDTAMPGMDHSKMGRPEATATPQASPETYTCVMHAHIAEPTPGKCPICGMALVRKPEGKK